MLRTTITSTPTEQTWSLQGQLVRPWIAELRCLWKKAHTECQSRKCVVDLSEVTFIDENGEKMLAKMMSEGAEFVVRGLYAKDLLEKLRNNLRRRASKVAFVILIAVFLILSNGCSNPHAS